MGVHAPLSSARADFSINDGMYARNRPLPLCEYSVGHAVEKEEGERADIVAHSVYRGSTHPVGCPHQQCKWYGLATELIQQREEPIFLTQYEY